MVSNKKFFFTIVLLFRSAKLISNMPIKQKPIQVIDLIQIIKFYGENNNEAV